MPVFVKICGIRNRADARAAIDAGADALGFLIGLDDPSDDAIDAGQAREIGEIVPASLRRVLVTHRRTLGEVARLVRDAGCDAVQLHGGFAASDAPALRDALPDVRIVGVVHVDGETALDRAAAIASWADVILLDTRTPSRLGGTGLTHDWSISARIVQRTSRPVVLAGGLTPDNVGAAIARVAPFGVDVNTGVEDANGAKDPALVRAYIAATRLTKSKRASP